MIQTPFLDVMRDRMAMEWETTPVNPEWPQDAADQRRTLMAMKRAVVDLGPAFLGPGSTLIAGDLVMRAAGSPSLIDAKIPRTKKYGYNPALMDAAKPSPFASRTTMLDSRDRTGEPSTPKSIPASAMTREKVWNALVSELERSECRRVGALVRRKTPLTPEDEAIQSRALGYEATALREWIREALREGG